MMNPYEAPSTESIEVDEEQYPERLPFWSRPIPDRYAIWFSVVVSAGMILSMYVIRFLAPELLTE